MTTTAEKPAAKKAAVKKTVAKKTAKRPVRRVKEQTATYEVWTWKEAEQALAKNIVNRHLRENDRDKYAREMSTKGSDGKPLWRDCIEPIAFDIDGNLIDGQHRLHAQVQSRTKQRWLVVRNAPKDAQRHINTGVARSIGDVLKFEGHKNWIVLGSIARWAWVMEQDALSNSRYKPSNEEILDMVNRHPDLAHSAEMASWGRGGFVRHNTTPLGAAHWWIAQFNDHPRADDFVARLRQNQEPEGSPLYALNRRFNEARMPPVEWIPTKLAIMGYVRCWNLDVKGDQVDKFVLKTRSGSLRLPEVAVREVKPEVLLDETG